MLEQTFQKINSVVSNICGSSFSRAEIRQIVLELQNILIEADVPYEYAKSAVASIAGKMEKTVGKKIDKQAIVGSLIKDCIDETFSNAKTGGIKIKKHGITTIGIFGTNGAGKTSFVAKLANLMFTKYKKRVLCVSFDTTRYAAQEQLEALCKKCDIEYLRIIENGVDRGIKKLKEIVEYEMVDILIVDFAGSSPENQKGLEIWCDTLNNVKFDERVVVLDGTLGQNAVPLIKRFTEVINPTGFVVSKIDFDQKGGIFFAIRVASDKPIYYISTGEKINSIAEFNRDTVSKALFSSDGLQSVIKAFQESNKDYIKSVVNHGINSKNNYNDLYLQLSQIVNFGKIDKILSILPHTKKLFNVKLSTEAYILIKKWISIINSMTNYERATPSCLNIERVNRIAKGAGVQVSDVLTLKKKLSEISNATT